MVDPHSHTHSDLFSVLIKQAAKIAKSLKITISFDVLIELVVIQIICLKQTTSLSVGHESVSGKIIPLFTYLLCFLFRVPTK